jgi:phenylacetate-CoA ligase
MAPDSIKHIRTVGETVSAGLRERLAKISGLRIEDSYSSQELGVIAIECRRAGCTM